MSFVRSAKSQGKRAVRALLVAAVMGIGVSMVGAPAAQAGTVWVADGVMHSGGSGPCDAFQARGDLSKFAVTNGCASGGALTIGTLFQGWFPSGDDAFWVTTAPPGITITGAWTQNGDVYGAASGGFVIGDFWQDNSTGRYGGSHLAAGQRWFNTAAEGTPNINSSIYGIQIVCTSTLCAGSTVVDVTGIALAGVENQGPSLAALGGNNLWYQASHWVHNDNGDGGFPITLASSDPSGVCNMWAVARQPPDSGAGGDAEHDRLAPVSRPDLDAGSGRQHAGLRADFRPAQPRARRRQRRRRRQPCRRDPVGRQRPGRRLAHDTERSGHRPMGRPPRHRRRRRQRRPVRNRRRGLQPRRQCKQVLPGGRHHRRRRRHPHRHLHRLEQRDGPQRRPGDRHSLHGHTH